MKQVIRLSISFCMFGLLSEAAYAYIDPGTGSALIQGLIAVVAAVGITVRLYWHRLIRFLGLKKDDTTDDIVGDQQNDRPDS